VPEVPLPLEDIRAEVDWKWFIIGVLIAFLPSVVSYFLAPTYFLPLDLLFILVGMYVSLKQSRLVKTRIQTITGKASLVEQKKES
jgi:hypothetical protein